MSRYFVCGALLAALFVAPVWAESPPGAEKTKNGTIIWKAPRTGAHSGEMSAARAPAKDSILWNDAQKAGSPVKSTGAPDRNGIIWNDPPGTAAQAVPVTPPSATPPQSASVQTEPCREYDTEITVEGRRQAMRGTACRQPDGRWRVISQVPR